MNLNSVSLLILALVKSVILGGSSENGFSTTQQQQLGDKLDKYEDKLKNSSHLLEAMENDIQKIQKSLEDIKLLVNTNHKGQPLSKESIPQSCSEIKKRGGISLQPYLVKPKLSSEPFLVRCNMETRGGGWTYVLNRFNGSQTFNLDWVYYKNGFGSNNELWLGLEYLYQLTASEVNELLVEVVDWNDNKVYAHYTAFRIGNETEGYPIKVLEGYSGDAGNSLTRHVGMKFSTRDHNINLVVNCADRRSGGWWYGRCVEDGKLTGVHTRGQMFVGGTYWRTFRGDLYSLKEARMMIKPRSSKD